MEALETIWTLSVHVVFFQWNFSCQVTDLDAILCAANASVSGMNYTQTIIPQQSVYRRLKLNRTRTLGGKTMI